jgi:hypothetical protein
VEKEMRPATALAENQIRATLVKAAQAKFQKSALEEVITLQAADKLLKDGKECQGATSVSPELRQNLRGL